MKLRFFVSLLICMTLFAMVSCTNRSDEHQIHSNIATMVESLNAKNNAGVRKYLSEFFLGGERGRSKIGKADARKLLTGYFLRYKNVHVAVSDVSVKLDALDNHRAQMTATVLLAGAENLLPDSAGRYSLVGTWENEEGAWRLIVLEWY